MEGKVKNINDRIDTMSKYVNLLQKRDELRHTVEFTQFLNEIKKTETFFEKLKAKFEHEIDTMKEEYNTVMYLMREKQLYMINYMLKAKKEKIAKEKMKIKEMQLTPCVQKDLTSNDFLTYSSSNKPLLGSSVKNLSNNLSALKITNKNRQASEATPFKVCAKRILPFELLEFEVDITLKEFEAVPKYMRGRTSLDEFLNFLKQIIIPCFEGKYKLLSQPRNSLTHSKDLELWRLYHSQISYAPGSKFITAGDIARKIDKIIDKKMQNFIVMLRHLGILNEQRASSTVCYIWKLST